MPQESLQPLPRLPDWSVQPQKAEVVRPDGQPTFEILQTPEEEKIFQIALTTSGEALVLPPEVAEKKENIIAQRKSAKVS